MGWVVEERTYRFLTPVFGGGVRVEGHRKHADPRTPVRVPSIRGQLRFWWRACNPRRCTTIETLHTAEGEVFGLASDPSPLSIAVLKQPASRTELRVLLDGDQFRAVPGMDDLAYGAFPLRDPDRSARHGVLHEHRGDWIVGFRYPERLRDDIEAARWAWAHFGGLGGRTRRGFGAIVQITGPLPSIEDGWGSFVGGVSVPWPHLGADSSISVVESKETYESGMKAQATLLRKLRHFRQGGDFGRRRGEGQRPGRSYWPEPDAIRRLLKTASVAHKDPVNRVDKFPRAAFGLPVIFHFKDGKQGDPDQTTLVPVPIGSKEVKPGNRLASPLLLRPHMQSSNRITAMGLRIEHAAPERMVLVSKNNKRGFEVKVRLTAQEATELAVTSPSPFVSKSGSQPATDPIARFLEEIR